MAAIHVSSRFWNSPVARLVAVAALVAVSAANAQEPAARATARERSLTGGARERVDLVKAASAAGAVRLDARRIGITRAAIATDLSGASVPVQADGDTISVDPAPGQWVVVKPAEIPLENMRRGLQWLPGVCVVAPAGGGAKTVFSTYADFPVVPVVWDTQADAYRFLGHIGIARDGDAQTGGPIGRNATVKMNFVGVSGVAPVEVEVSTLGIDGETKVECTFVRTDVPNPTLVVRSSLSAEQPYALDVQPRVELTPRRNPILGLGLEEIVVVAECVQAHGAPVALSAASPITVACSSGREDGVDGLRVSSAEPQAVFRFRSTWIGPARIVATVRTPSGAVLGSVSIQQDMPWAQLLTAVAGGALGGFTRRFIRGARKRQAQRRVLEGAIVGLVAFLAGVLGVGFFSIPSVIVATIAGAFLTGIFAGFTGVSLLEKLSRSGGAGARG